MLGRILLGASLFWAVWAHAASESSSPVLLDEVVAVVDLRETHVILFSELQTEARLEYARQQGADGLKEPLDAEVLSETLDRMINQLVILDEAAKLQLAEPAREEVDQRIASMQKVIGAAPFKAWVERFDLDDDLHDIVRRELRVAQYLEGRFRRVSRPKDTDVAAYITAHPELRGHEGEVREKLSKARFEQLSAGFIADVRRRARIRILHDPSTPPGATPLTGTVSASGG